MKDSIAESRPPTDSGLDRTRAKESMYLVVINDEEQYSIWPDFKDTPPGWRAVGGPATREECLRVVEREWIDLRPRSLRQRLAGSTPE